jgi:hypothetical protein
MSELPCLYMFLCEHINVGDWELMFETRTTILDPPLVGFVPSALVGVISFSTINARIFAL